MPPGLTLTGASSSRSKNPGFKSPLLRRSSSSVTKSSSFRRSSSTKGNDHAEEDVAFSRLDDQGPVRSLAGHLKIRDVPQCLEHISSHMFDEIPERSGMNSTKLVGIRTFRNSLPPLASLTHVYALSKSPTQAERDIAQLVLRGVVRKLTIPRRGVGSTMTGEFIVLVDHWISVVERHERLSSELKEKYVSALRLNPTWPSTTSASFTSSELTTLIRAGFFTSTSSYGTTASIASASSKPSALGTFSSLVATAGARHASGTAAAVGGSNAIYDAGGRMVSSSNSEPDATQAYSFTLPSVGSYLQLLSSSREHLLALLAKSQYGEAPAGLLRERWDGGVASSEKPIARSKGLEAPVLPGRTRKWKQFYGLRFWHVLGECLGTGAIEGFETGSVGLGVRLAG